MLENRIITACISKTPSQVFIMADDLFLEGMREERQEYTHSRLTQGVKPITDLKQAGTRIGQQ